MPDLPIRRDPAFPAVPRSVARAIEVQRGRATVNAAKVDAVAFVGTVAMFRASELTDLEARLIKLAPLGEPRYQAIADTTCAAMLAVVQRMATELY